MDDSFFDLHTYEGQWIEGLIYASKGSKLAKNWIEGLPTPIPTAIISRGGCCCPIINPNRSITVEFYINRIFS